MSSSTGGAKDERVAASARDEASVGRIVLANEDDFRLGGLAVEPSRRRVAMDDGREEILEPRVMQVLTALARANGRIVTRDELVESCWDGLIVSEDSINRAIGRVRRLSERLGAGAFTLETIARVGYHLKTSGQSEQRETPSRPEPRPSPVLPDKPSLAVLPFANLSDDPGQDYFADGLVEEITVALSRIKSFLVIASASSRALKSAGLDHGEAARALGVRYLLEGSVRKAAGRVRITVGLIDSSIGAQIWGDRFEDTLEDVFALQDRVSLAVVGVLEPTIRTAEIERALQRPAQTLGSYDLYLRAFSVYQSLKPDDVRAALALATEAIELDPRNAAALSLAANCHGQALLVRWGDDRGLHRHEGLELARRALQAAPNDPEILARVVEAFFNLGEDLRTIAELAERAVALNPGSAHAHSINGWFLVMMGHPERAAEELRMALRLDPISAGRSLHMTGLAASLLCERRFAEAADLALQAAHLQPHAITNQVLLAICYGHLGDAAGASKALAAFEALRPGVGPRVWLTMFREPRYYEIAVEGMDLAEAAVRATV
jgi:TolB-like protein